MSLSDSTPIKIGCLIPSYRRPRELERCLEAIRAQGLPPTETIVSVREGDEETRSVVGRAASRGDLVRACLVAQPGVVSAMQAGLGAFSSEIDVVALTDDDAVPRADWTARLARWLGADPGLVGVGGRDFQSNHVAAPGCCAKRVGKVQWFGRVSGNHHLGVGPPREVDVLKGVNCAFRIGALRRIGFDRRLRGGGAQVHWELSLCLEMRRSGGRLLYDPSIAVDHYPAERLDQDINHRGGFHASSLSDAVHNETLALLEHLGPARRLAFAVWAALIGTRDAPGIGQVLRAAFANRTGAETRFKASMTGRIRGFMSYRASRRLARRADAPGSGLPPTHESMG